MRGIVDELPFAFGWIAPEPAYMRRASHALGDAGHVWLVDPVDVDSLDERMRVLGEPAGVIQLLDRHARDCAALAARLDLPLHRVPFEGVPGSPFEVRRVVRLPGWAEAALWWPERRTLVVADAVGTAPYFLAPGEALGVHPLLRAVPPRSLLGLPVEHVLCGHGTGVHAPEATTALDDALRGSRRGIPRWLIGLARGGRG